MAQTAPPLPRFRPSSATASRAPRLLPLDGVWIVGLALLDLLVSALLPHAHGRWIPGACLTAVTTAFLYLYGWRARDRAAGIIAALLALTSLPFLLYGMAAPLDALFAALMMAALFSFLAGSSLLALALAGFATAARPDSVLLGLVLLVLALAQRRRRAPLGAAVFVAVAALAWFVRHGIRHSTLHLFFSPDPWLLTLTVASGMAFVSWLLVPFCAELGEPVRRARWLPLLLWTMAYMAVESFLRVTDRAGTAFGLVPLWYALAGGGLSRLLPAVTGDVPLPWMRYGLATLAVLAIVGIRFGAERSVLSLSLPAMHHSAVIPLSTPIPSRIVVPPPTAHALQISAPKAPAKAPAKPPAAPPKQAPVKSTPATHTSPKTAPAKASLPTARPARWHPRRYRYGYYRGYYRR